MATTTPNFGWAVPTSTDLVKDGAVAIETLGDSIDASLVDLKGGTTGQVLAKASNTDMDFTWSAGASVPTSLGFAAGKNKVLNGDFNINQRNFTSVTSGYGFDRWKVLKGGDGTCTYTPQTFTPGTAPVAGYEGRTYPRLVTTGTSSANEISSLSQYIESVRTLANQAIVISFWAKTTSGTPKVAVAVGQEFGTGGSPSAIVDTFFSQVTLSTSWTRYTVTGTVPSISGKTIGTNRDDALRIYLTVSAGSDFNALTGSLGTQNGTFEFWGVQVEAGSTATAFQTATGTIAGELAACQRYYVRYTGTGAAPTFSTSGISWSATNAACFFETPVTMRVTPTVLEFSTLKITDQTAYNLTVTALVLDSSGQSTPSNVGLSATNNTGATTGRSAWLCGSSSSGYVGLSAEL
jgi:hypothetical protein